MPDTAADKLQQLLSRSCSVCISVNDHRMYYETACQWLARQELEEIPIDVLAEMIRRNEVIDISLYPSNPISSYRIVHYDLSAALDEALRCLDA